MARIGTSRLLLVLPLAAFFTCLHGSQIRAQALIEIDPSTFGESLSVRVPVGTPFMLTARVFGYNPTGGCRGTFTTGEFESNGVVTFSLSGQTPPGTRVVSEGWYNSGPFDVVEGTPTVPGTYYMSAIYHESDWILVDNLGRTIPCSGYFNQLYIQIVVTEPKVDSLEITQAIQENKSPSDLYKWLTPKPSDPLRISDMPVPLVEGKPVLVRVYLKEVQHPTLAKVIIGILPPGTTDPLQGFADARSVTLIPGCTPRTQRLHLQNRGAPCESADFYLDSSYFKAGNYRLWVGLEDLTNVASGCTGLNEAWSCPEYWNNSSSTTRTSQGSGYLVGSSLGCLESSSIDVPVFDSEFDQKAVWGCMFPPFAVNKASTIVFHPISVCYDPTDLIGSCGDVTEIKRMSTMIRQVAPTGTVKFGSTGDQLVVEPTDYSTPDDWWDKMSDALEKKINERTDFRSIPGERHILYGVVHPDAPGNVGGQAILLGNSAASRTSVIRFEPADGVAPGPVQNVETNVEVMAHETGHVFGLEHTGSWFPHTGSAPGCYSFAGAVDNPNDPTNQNFFFWPYVNTYLKAYGGKPAPTNVFDKGNYLYSGDPAKPKMEVGVDLPHNLTRGTDFGEPNQSFEMMSYCSPRWVTPWSYRSIYKGLSSTSNTTLVPLGAGLFDELSGSLTLSSLTFQPVFTLETVGPTDQGSGTYRIELRNSSGGVLYTRWFTPRTSTTESASGDVKGTPHFAELLPHQAGAASVAVVDDAGTQLGSIQVGGAAPTVKILFPTGGEVLHGIQNIRWNANDPYNSSLTYRVQYSINNGNNWDSLVMAYDSITLPVNFDQLPGANGTALIRVYASNGASSAMATSKAFSVPKKLPRARISYPANGAIFHVGEFLNLEGIGFDPDTGILSGPNLTWSSTSLGSSLGTSDEVNFGYLSESAIGSHTIKLTATDSDGNQAADSIEIKVQEKSPVVYPDASPIANAGESYIGAEGSTIEFSSSGSYASDLTPLTYAWNFGDGGASTGESPTHVFADNGTYQITLTVTDHKGRSNAATATATISDAAPQVTGGAAVTGKTGRPANLTGNFSDPGLLDAPWRMTWDFGDGTSSSATNLTLQGSVSVIHAYLKTGQFTAKVMIVDKDGLAGSATVPVMITSIYDLNSDGKVDCADLAIIKASFGKKTGQVGFDPRADVNGDGIVNVLDLSVVARQVPAGTRCP